MKGRAPDALLPGLFAAVHTLYREARSAEGRQGRDNNEMKAGGGSPTLRVGGTHCRAAAGREKGLIGIKLICSIAEKPDGGVFTAIRMLPEIEREVWPRVMQPGDSGGMVHG